MATLYVAEDSPVDRRLLATVLAREGHHLEVFEDGLEAYRRIQEGGPLDLLVVDVLLPGLGGLAMTSLLRFHEETAHVPVLVTSSITEDDIGERAREAGADAFLPKPLRVEDLVREARRLLEAGPEEAAW